LSSTPITPRQPHSQKIDDVMDELAEQIPLTKVSKKSGFSLPRLHRARLRGELACIKILGQWCTTPDAIRSMIRSGSSDSSAQQAKAQAATRTDAARRNAADKAMAEIKSLTA
jgi:hypothetical protein